MDSTVKAVKKGTAGDPGELKGQLQSGGGTAGNCNANTNCGVFGTMEPSALTARAAMPVARPEESRDGAGHDPLSNIRGDTVEEYDIEIARICSTTADTPEFYLSK